MDQLLQIAQALVVALQGAADLEAAQAIIARHDRAFAIEVKAQKRAASIAAELAAAEQAAAEAQARLDAARAAAGG